MNKKEKDKIINSLMGFYQLACSLFESLSVVEDKDLKGILLIEHIFQLLIFHKEFTIKHLVAVPDVDSTYRDYCDEYEKKIGTLQDLFKKILTNHNKNNNIGYIT